MKEWSRCLKGTDLLESSFQLLSCQISIRYEDPDLRQILDYLSLQAVQNIPGSASLSYLVTGTGPYEIREEGDLLDRVHAKSDVQFHVYQRVYRRVLERYVLAGWIALHAGLVQVGGKRMLLLGAKGAGKTTLSTRLMFSGHRLEGDEIALLRHNEVMACPRRLHFKPGIEKQIPELSSLLDDLPTSISSNMTVKALDPSAAGFDWDIRSGPVDCIVNIEPNHGGTTRISRLSSFEILQHLLESYLGWGQGKGQVLDHAIGLAKRGGYRLKLGCSIEAVEQLQRLANQ